MDLKSCRRLYSSWLAASDRPHGNGPRDADFRPDPDVSPYCGWLKEAGLAQEQLKFETHQIELVCAIMLAQLNVWGHSKERSPK